MAEPPVPAAGNPSTEDPGENKPWDELFVNNPDEYFGNTNSQKESRPKIGDPKEVALHALIPKLPDPVVLKYGERLCSYAFLIV